MCNQCRAFVVHFLPSLLVAGAAGFDQAHASRLPDDDPASTSHAHDNISILRDLALVVASGGSTTDEKLDPVDTFLGGQDTPDLITAAKFAFYMAELTHALAGMIACEMEDRAIGRGDGVAAKFMLKGVGRDIFNRTDAFKDDDEGAAGIGRAIVGVMARHSAARAGQPGTPVGPKYEH